MGTEAVLTSTHSLYFGAKIRKICILLTYIEVGYERVYLSWTCYCDEILPRPVRNSVFILRGIEIIKNIVTQEPINSKQMKNNGNNLRRILRQIKSSRCYEYK